MEESTKTGERKEGKAADHIFTSTFHPLPINLPPLLPPISSDERKSAPPRPSMAMAATSRFLSLPPPTTTKPAIFSISPTSISLPTFRKRRSPLPPMAFASSTPHFIGRVGFHRREGNVSILSFGVNPGPISEIPTTDSSQLLSALLPFVVAATAVASLCQPSTFTWVSKELYAPALGGIMLSIGIKMSIDDFALAFQRPLPLSIGFMAQYALKPVLGVLLARLSGMSQLYNAGFVLTACVGGAQLSSYASYLSKGDVALCILLTSSTTIASVLMTPLLTGLLIGSVVPVDAVAMSKSILQVVLVPVGVGLALNMYAKGVVNLLRPVMPLVALFCTSLCIGGPLALNRNQILSAEGLRLVFPVLAFHTVAFIVGYWVPKIPIFRQGEDVCRTVSLCIGMQSSTLAGVLATQFLGSSQAVPPACSVVAMAIMGLSLASFWGNGGRIRDLPSLLLPETGSTMEAQ